MNESKYQDTMDKWADRKKNLNRALRNKSPFTYVQGIITEIKGDMSNEYMPEYGAVELDFINLSDDNIIKLFQSFLVMKLDYIPENDYVESYLSENIIDTLVTAYYFVATQRPHLIDKVNSIIWLDKIEQKMLSLQKVYGLTIGPVIDPNTYKSSIINIAGNCDESIMRYLVEDEMATNTYTLIWDDTDVEEQFSDSEIENDFLEMVNHMVKWTYNLWKNIHPFYRIPGKNNKWDLYNIMIENIEHFMYETVSIAEEQNGFWYTNYLQKAIDKIGGFSEACYKYSDTIEGGRNARI